MTKDVENQELTRELFTRLYDEHANMVRQVIIEYESAPEIVAELVQEVFARAWERKDQFRGEAQATTWLYRIAANIGANHVRDAVERSPEIVLENALSEPIADDLDGSWIEHHSIDYDEPEALLIAAEEALAGYEDLSPQEEKVFYLLYVEGLSFAEVGSSLGITPGTVRVVAHNIRSKIS